MNFQVLVFAAVVVSASASHSLLNAVHLDPIRSRHSNFGVGISRNDQEICDQHRLNICKNEFLRDIGAESLTHRPLRARHLVGYLQNLYRAEGSDGFQKVCRAGHMMKVCMADMFDKCLTVSSLVRTFQIDQYEAAQFVTVVKTLTYQCGPAHDYILSYWQCLNADYDRETQECMNDDLLNPCEYRQHFAQCYTEVVMHHCGKIAARVYCETLKYGLETPGGTGCSMTCPSNLYKPGHNLPESIKPNEEIIEHHDHRSPLVLRKMHVHGLHPDHEETDMPSDCPLHCNVTRLAKCSKEYFAHLHLQVPRNATEYIQELGNIVNKEGKRGFIRICRASHTLATCLGRERISCFSVCTLRRLGLSRTDAVIYHTAAQAIGYECGPAYKVFVGKFQCMKKTSISANATEVKCLEDFKKHIHQHPGRKCMYIQRLVDCALAPYTKACGREAGHALCVTERIALRASMPRCHLRCGRDLPAIEDMQKEPPKQRPSFIIRKFSVDHQNQSLEVKLDDATCDNAEMIRCNNEYYKRLGFSQAAMMSAHEFMKELGEFMQKNQWKTGFIKLCGASARYSKCLGRNFKSCFTISSIMSRGVSKADAMMFHSISETIAYECGPAYNTLVNKFDCINETVQKSGRIEEKCAAELARGMMEHPEKKCMYIQNFVDCSVPPIAKVCGVDAGNVLCQLDKISSKIQFPNCSITCRPHVPEPAGNRRHKMITQSLKVIGNEHKRALDRLHDTSQSCNEATFKSCNKQLGQALHMQSMPRDPNVFIHKLDEMLKTQGKSGFASFCSAVSQYKSCLGSQAGICLSLANLQKLGLSTQNATMYMALYAQFTDECGPDYQVLHDNFDCIIRVAREHHHPIEHCAHDFERFVKHDPEHACHFAQEFIICLAKPFRDHCNPAAGAALCNAEREAMDTVFSHCHLTCTPDTPQHFVPHVSDRYRLAASHEQESGRASAHVVSANACLDRQFNTSMRNAARLLGIRAFPKTVSEFSTHIHNWMLKSDLLIENRFSIFCSAANQFSDDLGGRQESCMSIRYLMKRGLTHQDAVGYITFFKEAMYQCGPAYQTYKDNIYCLLDTSDHQKRDLQTCSETFRSENVKTDVNSCSNAQQFVNCWLQPFKRYCTPETAHVLCNTLKIGFQNAPENCAVTCPPIVYTELN